MGHFLIYIAVAVTVLTLVFSAPYYQSADKCTLPKLENGVVRLRSRGRIIRFSCRDGYTIYGEKYAACNRGRWDVPMPACIKPGCDWDRDDFYAGSVFPSKNGALLKFVCRPGLRLIGPETIYCTGTNWNLPMPYCISPGNVSVSCNFENAKGDAVCGWRNVDWRLQTGPTPSSILGTGPNYDHTYAPLSHGHYMYMETSQLVKGQKAVLSSPVYQPMKINGTCFIFWYYMYGKTIGSLNVYLNGNSVFSKVGDQGPRWLKVRIGNLPNNRSFQIFIEGVTGPGYTGDIAIDDLHFSDSVDCIDDKDYMSCEGRCGEDPTIHQRACHCHNDCHEFGACCYNYVDVCTAEKSTTAWPGSESSYKSETTPYPIFNSSISLLTSVSLDSEPTQGSLDSDQYNTDDTRTDLVVDFTGTTDVTNFSLVPITKSPSVDSVSSSFPPSGQAEEYGTQRSLEIDVSPSIHPVTGLLLEPTSTEVMQSAHGLVSMTNATVIPVTKEHNTTVVADTSNHNVTLILPNLINKLNLTTAKTYRLAPTTTLPPAGPNVRIGTFSVVGINITLPALNLTPKSTIRSILPTSFAIPTPKSLNPISAILPNRQNKTFPPPVPTGVMFPRVGKQNPTTVTLFPPALNATFPALSLTMAGSQTTVSASKNTTILPVMLATLLPSTLNLTVEPIKPTLGIFPSVPLDPNITSPPVVITSTHFPFSIRTTSPTHLSSKAVKTLLFPTTPRISAGVKLPALIGAGPVSDSDTKWKSKFTPKGRYKFSARISEKDSSGQSSLAVGAVVIVCIVVASLAASTAWWLVRRRSHSLSYLRGNGRNTDGASDVLFLAADEILDFSIPGVDTGHSQQHQFAESTR